MNKEKAIEKINAGGDVEFEVFTVDEHKTYLNNFKKQSVDSEVAENVSQIHKRYDDDLLDLFGERKAPEEKTYNFLKRKVTELKDQTSQADLLKVKIKELEDAVKNNAGDEVLKKELQNVRDQYKTEKDKWSGREKELLNSLDTFKLETELDKAMIGLEFKKDIPDDLKDVFIGKVKADLIRSARIVDGKMIFVDDAGQTMVNKENALNPFTAKEMMSKGLESIITKGNKLEGPPKPKVDSKDGKDVIKLSDPGAKTRQEVSEYLIKSGISRSSKEYIEYYAEFTKDLPGL